MLNFVNNLYENKISSKGLAMFRIAFCLNLLFEVKNTYKYRSLYFDPVPYIDLSQIDFTYPLLAWMITIIFLIVGAFTKTTTILNYVFTLVIFSSMGTFNYHMNFVYSGINFILIFLPISNTISIDSLLIKLKYSNPKFLYHLPEKISVIYYFLPVFVGIGLIYFDSTLFKLASPMWLNGLGVWLPSSIPFSTVYDSQWLLNQEFIIKFLGYITLIFETLFIFLFWYKLFRIPLLIIGIGFHISIFIQFPIPFFAFGYIALYLLLVPVCFWEKISGLLKSKINKLTVFYNNESVFFKIKILIEHFDVFRIIDFKSIEKSDSKLQQETSQIPYAINEKGQIFKGIKAYRRIFKVVPLFYPIYFLLLVPVLNTRLYHLIVFNKEENNNFDIDYDYNEINKLRYTIHAKNNTIILKLLITTIIFLQLNASINSELVEPIKTGLLATLDKVHLKKYFISANKVINDFSRKTVGITNHTIFLDGHFTNFDKIYSLKFNNKLLPILDESGMPDKYILGGSWAEFCFRVNSPEIENHQDKLKKGLIRYAAFWTNQNRLKLDSTQKFNIVMKRTYATFQWQKDLLKQNMAMPWIEVGTLDLKNKSIIMNLEPNK